VHGFRSAHSCLGTVVTDALIGRLQIGARYSTKYCVIVPEAVQSQRYNALIRLNL
jgi:hypothetical protein